MYLIGMWIFQKIYRLIRMMDLYVLFKTRVPVSYAMFKMRMRSTSILDMIKHDYVCFK